MAGPAAAGKEQVVSYCVFTLVSIVAPVLLRIGR